MKKILIVFSFIVLAALSYMLISIPSEATIKGCLTTSMFKVELCPKSKNYVPLKQISNHLQKAIILTEDAGFYTHAGFDSEGIQHCWEKLKEKKKIVCGGSTISQQLSKNMFLSKNKNFLRKGLEALITVKLEKALTKKEILERYLNVVQFGKDIYGVKKAAQFYFKKSPANLDVVESAFLAMVLPNPQKYSQSYYRKNLTGFARKRIAQIINNMFRYHYLSEEQYITAVARLDSFLASGQKAAEEIPVDESESDLLTEEELDQMIEEQNY